MSSFHHFPGSKSSIRHFLFLTALVLISVYHPSTASSAQVTLAWDSNTEPNIAGYKVYCGTRSSNYPVDVNVGKATSYTLANLQAGTTYYLAATSYDTDGTESDFSTEIVYHAPSECSYAISPSGQSFSTSGGSGAVSVATQASCHWTAISNASWIIITSNSSLTGNGMTNYLVSDNPSSSTRSGTITVAGQTFMITQLGATQYTLTATSSGMGSGTLTKNPDASTYGAGTLLNLTATPDSNSVFQQWSGACSGTSSLCAVTMNSNISVAAVFALKTYTITASTGPNGSVSPSGQVMVLHGSSQDFSITPLAGYQIEDVMVDGTSMGGMTSYTFSDATANHSIQVSFTTLPPVEGTVPTEIMRLNFDEGSGNVALDTSGNDTHGTIYGASHTPSSAVGPFALAFDGINDYLNVDGNEALEPIKSSPFSVSLWVKHGKKTKSAYGGILKGPFGDGYYQGFRILDYMNKPVLQINFGDLSPRWIEGNPFRKGKWTHIVFTYDHQNIKLYQNGQLVQTIPETRNIRWDGGQLELSIGFAQWHFYGAIDKVALYNDVLAPSQVLQLFSEKRTAFKKN